MKPSTWVPALRNLSSILCGVTLVATFAPAAHAAIAPGASGNGELFFVVQDPVAQVSFTLDLGVTMDSFFLNSQQDAGIQTFWAIDPSTDLAFQSYLGMTNLADQVWAVMAADSAGPVGANGQRFFATARQGQEALVSTTLSQNLRAGIGASSLTNFLNSVNQSGTHLPFNDTSVNGSSVNALSDPGVGYFGELGGTGPRLQANALPFNMTNSVGQSSFFYQLGSAAANGPVNADEFDNLAHDGFWGFIYVDPALYGSSPFAGRYLLSYTLQPALLRSLATTADGRARSSLTEYRAGTIVEPISNPAAEFAGYIAPSIAAVPEPPALALAAMGALGLLLLRRRKSDPQRA